MDIYYTNCQGHMEELGDFYREWTGKGYSNQYILCNSYFYVARDKDEDNKVVGSIQLIIMPDPYWQRTWGLVENVLVATGYRKHGIAKELMYHVEQQAELFGCKYIKLTSGFDKVEGHALYKSLGYKEGTSFKKELS